MFCALNRTAQEMLWQAAGETVWRETDRMQDEFDRLAGDDNLGGSIDTDPDFRVPAAIRNVNIHLQPGGYALEFSDSDIVAGALYEYGGALYSMGQGVGTEESKAEIVHRHITEQWPDFKPARILDMACSAGSSSTPYSLAWPNAEVHAVDVGPGMLRYAHARARALGARVHFHQRDGAATGFESESFDLIVSHNGMHEMSTRTQKAMMKETWRLLRPGGICVHQDVPLRYSECDTFTQFEYGWDLKNNNEPFWQAYATNDCESMLIEAGFPQDAITVGYIAQADRGFRWYAAVARKPESVSAAA
jgi:ubiquinone/menaquinone biosynthesis C-methylase UbiE